MKKFLTDAQANTELKSNGRHNVQRQSPQLHKTANANQREQHTNENV